jgi:predicted PurR-regulated permease PerM
MPRNRPQSSSAEDQGRTERVRHLFFLVWVVIGVVLLVAALGYVLGHILSALVVVGIAAFIVFILRVPVAWLERHRVPRWLGALIAYLGALLIVSAVMLIFIPIIWEQAIGLIRLIPDYVAQATAGFNEFYQQYNYLLEDSNIQQMVSRTASNLSDWAVSLVSQSAQGVIILGTNMVTSVIVLVMSLIVGYWVLMDLPKIGREMRVIIGPKREEEVMFVASALSRAFGGYLRGVTVAAFCTGIMAGIGYSLIDLPYPAVLGLLTGLMNFIPYVGPWIAGTIAAIIGLFISPVAALLTIIVSLLAQQLTDNFITPRVMSSIVELHPAITLVGVFVGGALGGITGLIVAIPLLSTVKVVYAHYFEKRTGRRLIDEAGALFKGSSTYYPNDGGVDAADAAVDDGVPAADAAVDDGTDAAESDGAFAVASVPAADSGATDAIIEPPSTPAKPEKESREQ